MAITLGVRIANELVKHPWLDRNGASLLIDQMIEEEKTRAKPWKATFTTACGATREMEMYDPTPPPYFRIPLHRPVATLLDDLEQDTATPLEKMSRRFERVEWNGPMRTVKYKEILQ